MKFASLGLIVVGLILLVLSFFWNSIAPKGEEMSEQKVEDYMQAVADMHGGGGQSGVNATGEAPKEESKALIEEMQSESDRIQRTRTLGRLVLQIAGVVSTLAGAGLFFWQGRE